MPHIYRLKEWILAGEALQTVGGKHKDLNQELDKAKQLSSTLIRDNVFLNHKIEIMKINLKVIFKKYFEKIYLYIFIYKIK